MCWECYAEGNNHEGESHYGLGPHEHSYDKDGNILIGGTRFLPLPERGENDIYDLGDTWFWPDPEAPGCGIITPKPVPGWM